MTAYTRAQRVIWVVRHGQRADNIDGTWRDRAPRGAWDDPPLSERGLKQAHECGIKLANEPIDIILCSPFLRCVQTTNNIVKNHSKPLKIFIEPGVCETLNCCQYPPGCLSAQELSTNFPIIDPKYEPIVKMPGPEKDIVGCKDRLTKVIDCALAKYPGVLLLATHGSPTAMIHEILTGTWHYVGQCTLSKFISDENGNFKAALAGDSTHLSDRTNLRDHEFTRPNT